MDICGYLDEMARTAGGEYAETLREMSAQVSQLEANCLWLKKHHLGLLLAIDKQTPYQARCDWDGKWLIEPRA